MAESLPSVRAGAAGFRGVFNAAAPRPVLAGNAARPSRYRLGHIARRPGRKREVGWRHTVSHLCGAGRDFTDPHGAATGMEAAKEAADFPFAVQAVRAWRIAHSHRPTIKEFAPATYFAKSGETRATFLGSQGDRLTAEEARKLLQLTVEETAVYGEATRKEHSRGLFEDVLRPSRPGPVSRRGYDVEPAEGAKHLYVLKCRAKRRFS